MKFSSSLSLFSTALLVLLTQASADLQQKWNIGAVAVTNVGNDFTFLYPGTDKSFLTADDTNVQDKAQVTIYAFACKISDEDTTYGKIGIEDSEFTNTSPFEMASLAYEDNESLAFKVTAVTKNMAKLPAITSPTVNDVSEMKFCVRIGLYAATNEINFQENEVTLTVTMSGGFTITDLLVAPKVKSSDSATQSYTVSATLCTDEQQAPTDNDGKFNQGAAIRVCISPDTQALLDGVVLTSVDTFQWTRSYSTTGDADTVQEAVASANIVSTNGLTLLDEGDNTKFVVTSVLFAKFYETTGEVAANGAATMAFPDARRLGNTDNRHLQDGGSTEAAFAMTAELNKADDGPVPIQQIAAAGAGTSFTVVATIVGLVSAILLA